MWNLKNKTNEQTQQNKNRVIDIENETGGCQIGGVGRRKKIGEGIKRCKLPPVR